MPDVQASPAPRKAHKKNEGLAGRRARSGAGRGRHLCLVGHRALDQCRRRRRAESTLALETFVVNLNGSGQRAYLRVGITLGMAHPLPRNRAEGVPTALVRDTILSVLATAQPEALLQVEGKRQLKEELLKALQERVPQMAVENVYFTEFLVQM